MRYWEACEAQVTIDEAIRECRIHNVQAIVRPIDLALVDAEPADVVASADANDEYSGADILGYLGY